MASRFSAPINLGLDQRRIFQQANDLRPDELIQVILPDGAVCAHRPFQSTIAIRAKATIVVQLLFGSSR
jgi:hypothetical protein